MKQRTLTPARKRSGPTNPLEWEKLLAVVIAKAEGRQDPRTPFMKSALAAGQAETMLRNLGILSATDITREFPNP